jgi:hypothetical protein
MLRIALLPAPNVSYLKTLYAIGFEMVGNIIKKGNKWKIKAVVTILVKWHYYNKEVQMKMNKGLTLKLLGIMVIAIIALACSPKKSEQDERIAALEAQLAALSETGNEAKAAELQAELSTAQANREQQSGSTAQTAAPPPSTPKAEAATAQTQTASQPNASGTTTAQTAAGSTTASQTTATGNFQINGTTLTKYNGNEASVTIPNTVTTIGKEAFNGCTGMKSVTIPNSVTTIERMAFANCSNLTSITIPNSVTRIEYGAFFFCNNLTNVTIPSSVTVIGEEAFQKCYNLKNVTIPNSVTSIGSNAFADCSELTKITILGRIDNLSANAFPFAKATGRGVLRGLSNEYYDGAEGTPNPGTFVYDGDSWSRQ